LTITAAAQVLVETFVGAAEKSGFAVAARPGNILSAFIPLERELGRSARQTPSDIDAVTIGHHVVLFADLPGEFGEEKLWGRMKDLHVWSGLVRSGLPGTLKDDLSLILIGPPGSERLTEWRAFSATVERDDRVCRKLVWLPSTPQDFQVQAGEFIGRTFLAKPWAVALGPQAQELDVGRRFQRAIEQTPGLDPADVKLAAAWWPILVAATDEEGEPVSPGAPLVKRLIEALKQGGS